MHFQNLGMLTRLQVKKQKNINKDINKDFKQNSFNKKEKYNAKEIYDSGRYDFDEIERIARKRIIESLEDK